MIKKKDLSEEDLNTWETYIKNPSDLYDKEKNIQENQERKERFRFDLHGHTLDEANQRVRDIIFSCVKQKYKEILFITGKGLHSTSDKDAYVSKDLSKLKIDALALSKVLHYNVLSVEQIKQGLNK